MVFRAVIFYSAEKFHLICLVIKKKALLVGLAATLALFFAVCDRKEELPDNESLDGYVAVRIRSISVSEGGSESPTRSVLQKEPEMISTPVSDGMLMEMSIKEDDSPLRDKIELATGTHFRVIAATGTSNYYSHGDYIYGSGTLTPTNDFHEKIDQSYSFTCISYNSATLPPTTGYTVGDALPLLVFRR
jgi:hypothetical protein